MEVPDFGETQAITQSEMDAYALRMQEKSDLERRPGRVKSSKIGQRVRKGLSDRAFSHRLWVLLTLVVVSYWMCYSVLVVYLVIRANNWAYALCCGLVGLLTGILAFVPLWWMTKRTRR